MHKLLCVLCSMSHISGCDPSSQLAKRRFEKLSARMERGLHTGCIRKPHKALLICLCYPIKLLDMPIVSCLPSSVLPKVSVNSINKQVLIDFILVCFC